jgi:hypothetical protein
MKTQQQINTLTERQCQRELKQLHKTYDTETAITKLKLSSHEIEQVTNQILWLEDRIEEIARSDKAIRAVETKLQQQNFSTAVMTPNGRAESIREAADLMGYSINTIHTYLTTKPSHYYRIE